MDLDPVGVSAHRSVEDGRQYPGLLVDRITGHRVRYLADREQVTPAGIDCKAARLCLGRGVRNQGQRAGLGNPAAEQALGPPTNPVEMGLPEISPASSIAPCSGPTAPCLKPFGDNRRSLSPGQATLSRSRALSAHGQ